jgi:dTDP-glucose 4,6-dehydratase
MATVAVTGAGGFIGSHLVDRLLADGHEVRAFVRYTSMPTVGFLDEARAKWPDRLEIVRGTIEDPSAVRKLADGTDVVFHLAALIGIPLSFAAPYHYVATNLIGTVNVLDSCRESGVRRMVQVSTSETYGTPTSVPISEEHPFRAQSPYAATKAGADHLALSYFRSFSTPVVVIRPFNTFGPRQSARAVIPTIVTQALSGDVIRLGSLLPRRDLTFVSDTVSGLSLAAFTAEIEGEEINLGTGRSWSVAEIADMVIARTNPQARIELDPERLRPERSEIPELLADTGKAERLLGFSPTVTFQEGLDIVIQDIRENLDRYCVGDYVL